MRKKQEQSSGAAARRKERQAENDELRLAAEIRDSRAWQKCRAVIIAQNPICCDPFNHHSQTHQVFSDEVHHVIALHIRPDLAFTESNLRAICSPCHRRISALERAGKPSAYLFRNFDSMYSDKPTSRITVIWGPPGAGKSTLVKQHAKRGDAIVDFDALFSAISGCGAHDRVDNLFPHAQAAREAIENVIMRTPSQTAWVIYSRLDDAKRKQWQEVGATLRLVFAPRDTCLARCMSRQDGTTSRRIDAWFDAHGTEVIDAATQDDCQQEGCASGTASNIPADDQRQVPGVG